MPISHAVRSRSRGATIALLGTLVTTISAASLRAEPAATGDPAIRQIVSKHLTLLTDLPASEDVDSLPAIFDQAFPQWCAYFEVDPAAHADWHMRGHLMQSRQRFEAAGLLPAGLPNFTSGYAHGDQLWLYDQIEPLLSPASAAARGHARLHVHLRRRHRPAVVCRGHGRTAGHAPPGRRPADAQLFSARIATRFPSGAGSRSCRRTTPTSGDEPGEDRWPIDPRALVENAVVRLVLGGRGVSRWPSALPARAFASCAGWSANRISASSCRSVFGDDWPRAQRRLAAVRGQSRLRLRFRADGSRAARPASRWPTAARRRTVAADRGWQASAACAGSGTEISTARQRPLSGGHRAARLVVRARRRHDSLLSRPAAGHPAGRRPLRRPGRESGSTACSSR